MTCWDLGLSHSMGANSIAEAGRDKLGERGWRDGRHARLGLPGQPRVSLSGPPELSNQLCRWGHWTSEGQWAMRGM